VLGQFRNGSPWGELPLVVDTSAWARGNHPHVRELWIQALLADRLRISPLVRFEILLTARDGHGFDVVAERLSALRHAPLTTAVIRAAQDAMRTLAHRYSGAQRLPIVDYVVAAAAQESGSAVLHYDSDYETLAEVMAFESVWLAPAGSIP
jgi:predicted nucleic acid-binding protein